MKIYVNYGYKSATNAMILTIDDEDGNILLHREVDGSFDEPIEIELEDKNA